MARELPLRKVQLIDGAGQHQILDYGLMLIMILKHGGRQGLTLDEVIQAADALEPIEAAVEAGADKVTLTDTQWRTLVDKLAAFPFGVADRGIATFGRMIREAPEIGTGDPVQLAGRSRA